MLHMMHARLFRVKQSMCAVLERFLGRKASPDEMPGIAMTFGARMMLPADLMVFQCAQNDRRNHGGSNRRTIGPAQCPSLKFLNPLNRLAQGPCGA